MKYVVFDTETSGLDRHDEVVQFSGLVLDDDLVLKNLINFYCYTQVPINPKASAVTGLTSEFLMKQSGGRTFEDYFLSLPILKEPNVTWVGYNVSFDIRLVNQTLENNGLPKQNFGVPINRINKESGIYNFDVMQMLALRNGGIKQKLSVVAKQLKCGENRLTTMYKKFLTLARLDCDTTFHNSLYDAMITWLLLVESRALCS